METGLLVGDVMTKRPISVPRNLTVRDCARLMSEKDIGSILVAEGERIYGILTEADLVREVIAKSRDTEDTPVSDVMTFKLITVTPDKDVLAAITLMRDHDIRHLPVIHEDRLVGFLTAKDILKVEPALFENLLDVIELREEERKLASRPQASREGFCEICGNFSERLAKGPDQRLICEDCRD